MLDAHGHAVALDRLDDDRGEHARHEGILGIVFQISARERVAAHVDGRPEPHADVVFIKLRAEQHAERLHQRHVPGIRKNGVAGIHGAHEAEPRAAVALREAVEPVFRAKRVAAADLILLVGDKEGGKLLIAPLREVLVHGDRAEHDLGKPVPHKDRAFFHVRQRGLDVHVILRPFTHGQRFVGAVRQQALFEVRGTERGQALGHSQRIHRRRARLGHAAHGIAHEEAVVARLQHPAGLVAGLAEIVEGRKLRQLRFQRDRLAFAGREGLRLAEIAKDLRRLAEHALRRGDVQLNDLLAGDKTDVCDDGFRLDGVAVHGEGASLDQELGVGQTEAELIVDSFIVGIKGLEPTVADEDILGIRLTLFAPARRGGIILEVLCPRIVRFAGGVHAAEQHVRDADAALHAGKVHVKDGVHADPVDLVLRPGGIDHAGGVEHDHDLFEGRRELPEQRFFILTQIPFGAGQVERLARPAAEEHDRSCRLCRGSRDLCVRGRIRRFTQDRGGIGVARRMIQRDFAALFRCLQRVQRIDRLLLKVADLRLGAVAVGDVAVRAPRRGVVERPEPHRVAEQGDLRAARDRQRRVFVLEQHDALVRDHARDLLPVRVIQRLSPRREAEQAAHDETKRQDNG